MKRRPLSGCRGTHDRSGATSGAEGGAAVCLRSALDWNAGSFDVPLASTIQQLLRSPAYRSVGELLRSDVLDHWDEGEWRLLIYTAVYDGRQATAVFAVPLLRYEPDAVKVAGVDEEQGETLLTLAAR